MTADDPTLPEGFAAKTGPAAFSTQAPPAPPSGGEDVAALETRCTVLEGELARMKDQALRALAEAENTRRRAERDREDAIKYATTNFARDLLSVTDNFARALEAIPPEMKGEGSPMASLISGIDATAREMQAVFDRFGIRPVEALDKPFNPNLHEVMFELPGTGKPAGTVVQVMERGYTIHDRLLRPARVGIAKAEPGETAGGSRVDQMA